MSNDKGNDEIPSSVSPLAPLARWVFVVGVLFYLVTTSASAPGGDGALLWAVSERLVQNGTICMGPVRTGNTYELESGCRVSDYGLGASLVWLPSALLTQTMRWFGLESGPAYENMYALLSHLMPSVVGGLAWMFFFVLAVLLGAKTRRALLVTLLFGTTTTVWFHARNLYSENLQMACLLAAVCAFFQFRRQPDDRMLFWGGLAVGLASLTKAILWTSAPLFALYALYGVSSKRRWLRQLIVLGVALLPFLVAQLWHNAFRFGSLFDFGYHTSRDGLFGFSHPLGFALWGYLFSPSKSFFLYNPLALAALWGVGRFYRQHKPETLLFAGLSLLVVSIYGTWWAWHGDWSWGPRFLVVLVPFWCLPAIKLFPVGLSPKKRGLVAALCVLALGIQILGCSVAIWRYLDIAFQSTQASLPDWGKTLAGTDYKPIDDQLLVHNVPEFSPLLGQYWLLKHLILADPDFCRDHPWKSLGVDAWSPSHAKLDYGLDWWGSRTAKGHVSPSIGLVVMIGLVLGILLWGSVRRLWFLIRQFDESVS